MYNKQTPAILAGVLISAALCSKEVSSCAVNEGDGSPFHSLYVPGGQKSDRKLSFNYYDKLSARKQQVINPKINDGDSNESPQHNYHITPIYGKSITIRCWKTDSPYCIIFGSQEAQFILKSCGTSHLAKPAFFRYHKNTRKGDTNDLIHLRSS